MSKGYQKRRQSEIEKKKRRSHYKIEKQKLPITNDVICMSCGSPSGWTNDQLAYINGERELKCKKCKKPCITVMCKNKNTSDAG